jgi:hypothetical protein
VRTTVCAGVYVDIGQAEIWGQIDDLYRAPVSAGGSHHFYCHILGHTVRKSAKNDIETRPGESIRRESRKARQVKTREVGENIADALADTAVPRQKRNIGVGMAGEQANEFGARIATGAENADPNAVQSVAHRSPSLGLRG